MADKTKVWFGCSATSKSCEPRDAETVHVVVGGTQMCMTTLEDVAKHMPDFMKMAYQAGIKDERKRLSKLLGIE